MKRILVIDDDRAHLETTRDLLEEEGYDVITQAGPFGATERIMVTRPDLVLLDVNMPALSGEMLLQVVKGREQTREARVVLHSSNDEEALRGAARRLGAAGWICKGDPTALLRTVARLLDGPPGAFRGGAGGER